MKSLHLITLGEMLVHPSPEVRRHAQGALRAVEREMKNLQDEQAARLSGSTLRTCDDCGAGNMPARSSCRRCGARLHL